MSKQQEKMNGKKLVKLLMKSNIRFFLLFSIWLFLYRLDFEAQVNILKKSHDEKQKQFDIERDRFYEQIKSLEKTREELIKENTHLNTTLRQINDCQNDLEREQEKSRELYRKCVKLETQLSSTNGIEVIEFWCFYFIVFLFSARINWYKYKIKKWIKSINEWMSCK